MADLSLFDTGDHLMMNPFKEREWYDIARWLSVYKDPLHIPIGPIERARGKRIKEALNGQVQETLTKQMAIRATNHIKMLKTLLISFVLKMSY